jgi:hypothetical protein
MVEAVTTPLPRLPFITFVIFALRSIACGHVLDEYLQSTLVVIEPGDIRLKINLTPGIEIAEKVLNRIDRNGDGAVADNEIAAYAEMVREDLTVRLDGRETQLKLAASSIPEPEELRSGHGIIQMEFLITPAFFVAGNHRLTIENRHFDSLGVYLVNAARPHSASIRIAKQTRNVNQSRSEIEFAFAIPNAFSLRSAGFVASLALIILGMLAAMRRLNRKSTIASA